VAAAWVAVVGYAFLAGCLYPIVEEVTWLRSHTATTSGLLEACVSIGRVFAVAAAPFAAVVGIGVAVPLFRAMRHRLYTSMAAYLAAGLLLSIAAAALLALPHYLSADFLSDYDFSYAMCTIFLAGPIAALTTRHIARRR
jgi:hypothetical protein